MESRSPNDSDAEGGGGGSSNSAGSGSSPAGLLRALRDAGRPQLRATQDGSPDPGSPAPAVLSLDQIRVSRNSNEYTEGPTVAPRSPASQASQQRKASPAVPPAGPEEARETPDERHNNQRNLFPQSLRSTTPSAVSARAGVSRSSSAEDSRSSARTSTGSNSSAQQLLGCPAGGGGGERIIRNQPKHVDLRADELKPPSDVAPGDAPSPSGGAEDQLLDKHARRCERCGRCRCPECVRPRALPSCWLCGRRCVCSAQNAVEYGTCACCVKGLFYHCSSDDEDTCAERPFSCTQSHCCVRWTAVSILSLCLPCLLCYLPAKGCLAACQSCYDRARRPGCRCKDTIVVHCKGVDKPT